MNISSFLNKLLNIKLSKKYLNHTYLKIFIALLMLYFLMQLVRKNTPHHEGFTQREKFISKSSVEEIYDDFYNSIYDDLVYDQNKINYELQEIAQVSKMKTGQSTILDIGSGNGHHVETLRKQGYDAMGLELSKPMINRSKELYPSLPIKHGNVLESITFNEESFSHILCMYFTIYYIEDKRTFFENCYKWLKPNGYLALHLVNRDMFNPILSAGEPLVLVSPQKYAKDRLTKTVVKFKDFQYKAKFKIDNNNDKARFEETFKDDATSNIRKHVHNFSMPTQKYIIQLAKDCGFNLIGNIDLVNAKYEYQYVYILKKD